jgi:prepilin-type N-terminal cleavage/methylation domain-containing protein
MKNKRRQFGFSLIEVLMAVGILTVGLLMVAGTFPVGIHLVAVSTERTLGAVASDEAFAKIRLYGSQMNLSSVTLNPTDIQKTFDFNDVFTNYAPVGTKINPVEFEYPSTTDPQIDKRYSWSALFRFSNVNDAKQCQITVFASREVSNALQYYGQTATTYAPSGTSDWPLPVIINKSGSLGTSYMNVGADIKYFADDSVIVDDATGKIYRVIELDHSNSYINLDRKLEDTVTNIWVVPVPIGGGKNPCVGVYQRIINF